MVDPAAGEVIDTMVPGMVVWTRACDPSARTVYLNVIGGPATTRCGPWTPRPTELGMYALPMGETVTLGIEHDDRDGVGRREAAGSRSSSDGPGVGTLALVSSA